MGLSSVWPGPRPKAQTTRVSISQRSSAITARRRSRFRRGTGDCAQKAPRLDRPRAARGRGGDETRPWPGSGRWAFGKPWVQIGVHVFGFGSVSALPGSDSDRRPVRFEFRTRTRSFPFAVVLFVVRYLAAAFWVTSKSFNFLAPGIAPY